MAADSTGRNGKLTPLGRAAQALLALACIAMLIYFVGQAAGGSRWWLVILVPYAFVMLGSAVFAATNAVMGRRIRAAQPPEAR